ncbi:AHH domain-containing protein [Bradyrhizobium sp. CCGUVB1N3]|uniref:AHH domain-containing protein n=1 Tax=Bradyrhizobium sp. CCGUVB1N3 TaxID=2949629 RepID=UPI0020B31547|nr:AHH domain-containing protein [Bradyrhizobium sp. CCGUVB1N3]MCP3476984.1 AHH domain-containing protein [Bradyrhizobium sp. CCGUVB1N3]
MFHIHHVIPQAERFLSDLAVKILKFDIHSPANLMALPSDEGLANALNTSPHTGGHLGTYNKGFCEFLLSLQADPDFGRAQTGDPAAHARLSSDLLRFVAIAKYALANKHLLANTPAGMTPEDANVKNREWFANWKEYAEHNWDKIQQMDNTISQLHNSGQPDQAMYWPVLSPTSNLSLAEKIDILRRYRENPPISQQFTMASPIPDLPGFVAPVVDTRLPGFIPPSSDDLMQAAEGFTRHDPSLTYGLPGFPVSNPALQGLGPLPPSVAAPQSPQVLQFNQETGRPLSFSDGTPVFGPAAPSGQPIDQDTAFWFGMAALGAGAVLMPWAEVAAFGAAMLAGAAAIRPAFGAGAPSRAGTASGGVFSAGTAPYDAFNASSSASNANTSGGNPRGSTFGPPLIESNTLQQEPNPANTFADRFGNWTETSAGSMPAQGSGSVPGAARAVAPEDVRRLTRVNSSNSANAFTSGTSPVPYLPSSEFNDRFGNWSVPPGDPQSPQASRPVGAFADEPAYSIPPPIWGSEDSRGAQNDAEEWFSRWIRPLMRQDRMD